MELDKWQKEILETQGNIVLRSGRQCGKSTIISILAAETAVSKDKQSIMIISATERQAYLLFSKVLYYLDDKHKKQIRMGKDRPTKSEIKLKNGSIIRCLPTGLDGLGIRGYTIDLLIADEAAFIESEVFAAVTPALVTNNGRIILLSTPFGKEGYFYDCFTNPEFTPFHITTEGVAQERAEPQKSNMLKFLESEKRRMTTLQYTQEYMGEFVDELRTFFSIDWIKKVCIRKRQPKGQGKIYMGLDIARMGDDASTFEIFEKTSRDKIVQMENIVTRKQYTTETFDKIIELTKSWNVNKIGIDAGSGSLGVGILDFLMREPSTRNKIEALNNRARPLDNEDKRKTRLQKEDFYQNLKALGELNKLELLDDDEVILSLKSVQIEHVIEPGKATKVRIFSNPHSESHIVEGITRGVWLANEDKSLNLWCDYS